MKIVLVEFFENLNFNENISVFNKNFKILKN